MLNLAVEAMLDLPVQEPNGKDEILGDSDLGGSSTPNAPLEFPDSSSILSSARSMPDPFTGATLFQPLPKRSTGHVKQNDVIDLTLSSDAPATLTPDHERDPFMDVRTPPLNPVDDNPFRDPSKARIEFRVPPMPSDVINLESESGSTAKEEEHDGHHEELPDFSEVEKISRLSASYLVERQDRKRILIRYIHRLTPIDRQGISARTIALTLKESQAEVWSGLTAIKSHAHKIRGADPRTSTDILRIAQLYICWSQNTKHSPQGQPKKCVERTMEDVTGFECFYHFLCECLTRYEHELVVDPVVIDSTPEKTNDRPKRKKLFADRE